MHHRESLDGPPIFIRALADIVAQPLNEAPTHRESSSIIIHARLCLTPKCDFNNVQCSYQ